VSNAKDPVKMAKAMKLAIEAGRIPKRRYATASSPAEGMSIVE
jgi:thiazole synthase